MAFVPTAYLDFDTFRVLTTLPGVFVDDVERVSPQWIDGQLIYWSFWIDSRLRKRYATPFPSYASLGPLFTPPTVQMWLARIVTLRVWLKRGVDPNDLQFASIKEDASTAQAEILEAANSENGWFDLPLKHNEDGSAINRGNPRSYSEASPYVWTDLQAATGRNEDSNGTGSSTT